MLQQHFDGGRPGCVRVRVQAEVGFAARGVRLLGKTADVIGALVDIVFRNATTTLLSFPFFTSCFTPTGFGFTLTDFGSDFSFFCSCGFRTPRGLPGLRKLAFRLPSDFTLSLFPDP